MHRLQCGVADGDGWPDMGTPADPAVAKFKEH
jgi:hypothetical protein